MQCDSRALRKETNETQENLETNCVISQQISAKTERKPGAEMQCCATLAPSKELQTSGFVRAHRDCRIRISRKAKATRQKPMRKRKHKHK
jgi:hypothetical protein